MKKYICIHGHFYQPPRENPWTGAVERQESAHPYHNWNERISAECYTPNGTARVLDERHRTVQIINNYSRISFNFGPTLLGWLEAHAPETYRTILEADRQSLERFSGHGSALAQPYTHAILPLASRRQKEIQLRWGIEDFKRRFQRRPEGMWLPETAVDRETLHLMAGRGIRFTVLAPHQAARVRRIGARQWREVRAGQLNTTIPYRLQLRYGASINLFFYHGSLSGAIAFDGLLHSGERLTQALLGGFSPNQDEAQLVHVATDGETYGHHHRFGEMALAYALHYLETDRLARITNYGEHLEAHPPQWEVEIANNTSWSCLHGVDRWKTDCGCNSGSRPEWNQGWRRPLRQSLDWLSTRLDAVYEEVAAGLLKRPWQALAKYIEVIVDRSLAREKDFVDRHAAVPLTGEGRLTALKLLEMQRHAALMFTSCAWFFDDISGLEASQSLRHAGKAIGLAEQVCAVDLETPFKSRLAEAKSNLGRQISGQTVYERSVAQARSARK